MALSTPRDFASYVWLSGAVQGPTDTSGGKSLAETGQQVRFRRWSVMQAGYGSGSTANVTFAKADLDAAGIDLFSLAQAGLVEIQIFAPTRPQNERISTPQQAQLAQAPGYTSLATLVPFGTSLDVQGGTVLQYPPIFGGYMDVQTLAMREDTWEFECRDYTSLLMDADFPARAVQNMSIKQFVTSVAKQYAINTGETPNYIQGATLPVGTYLQRDRVITAREISPWNLLQELAHDLGWVCLITPNKELYFAPANVNNLPPRVYTWKSGQGDLKDLTIRHSPRRNRSFNVVVNSFHPKAAKTISARATQRGVGRNPTSVPTYTFYEEGLTKDQCVQIAKAKAYDIAKREYVLKGFTAGDGGLTPWGGGVIVRGTGLTPLEGVTWNVTRCTHSYEVPQHGSESSGYSTEWEAWNLPPSTSVDGGL